MDNERIIASSSCNEERRDTSSRDCMVVTDNIPGIDSCGNHIDNDSITTCNASTHDQMPIDLSSTCMLTTGLHISALPAEVLEQIFSHLTQRELCRNVAPVCHEWRSHAYNPIHWRALELHADTVADTAKFSACLERVPLLKSLSVCDCDKLTATEISYLGTQCPRLTSLEIGFTRTAHTSLCKAMADALPCLEHVNLEGCGLIDTSSIAALCQIVTLKSLNLSHCITLVGSDIIMLAERLPRLEKLNIDGVYNVADRDIHRLVELQNEHLRNLEIDGEQLSDRGLSNISQCHKLQKFGITYADNMTDNSLLHVKKMKLKWLKLRKGERLSSASLEGLFDNYERNLRHLTHLDLTECTQLKDPGVCAIVKCCYESLTYLALCWCWDVTDLGLQQIVNNCRQLKYLDILGLNQIIGSCLDTIPTNLPHLLTLNLHQCNSIDDDILLNVIRVMPQLRVINYYGEVLGS